MTYCNIRVNTSMACVQTFKNDSHGYTFLNETKKNVYKYIYLYTQLVYNMLHVRTYETLYMIYLYYVNVLLYITHYNRFYGDLLVY